MFFVRFYWFHQFPHVECEKFRWRQAKGVSGNQAKLQMGTEQQIFSRLILMVSPLSTCSMWKKFAGDRRKVSVETLSFAEDFANSLQGKT